MEVVVMMVVMEVVVVMAVMEVVVMMVVAAMMVAVTANTTGPLLWTTGPEK